MKSVSSKLVRARPLLGTLVEITAAGGDVLQLERAIAAAFGAVERVHHLMSFHDRESDVSRINRSRAGRVIGVHEWTYRVLHTAIDLQRRSRGAFNIAVAPALERVGLLPRHTSAVTFATAPIPDNALHLLPGNRVRKRRSECRIDLGGIAKGFAVDRALNILRQYETAGGLVNAGGDLAVFGAGEEEVAIRNPRDPTRLMARTRLCNAALASSGRIFDPTRPTQPSYFAVVDPEDGKLVTAISGATVRAASCTIADALTKVVMVAGAAASRVLDHYHAHALFMTAGGQVRQTANWRDVYPFAA